MSSLSNDVILHIISLYSWRTQLSFRQLSKHFESTIEDPTSAWIDDLRKGKYLKRSYLDIIIEAAKRIMMCEKNIVELEAPITVCGDIHGQVFDLVTLFSIGGMLPDTKYLFLGDYVNRGHHSIEVITWLLLLKCKYPNHIYLLRGNHETQQVVDVYGFTNEVQTKYGEEGTALLDQFLDVFNTLPLVALISSTHQKPLFCVHAGLSPHIETLDQIHQIDRFQAIPNDGPMSDLLWSDPEAGVKEWCIGGRGPGYLYGESILNKFLDDNNLQMVVRAHQLVQEGYNSMFDDKCVTVWSAPNYCYRCGNVAAIMRVDKNGKRTYETFNATEIEDPQKYDATKTGYFL